MTDENQIKNYWQERARQDQSPQSTTLDYYLREIEFNVIHDEIAKRKPRRVVDIGCGDAFTTLKLSAAFPGISFVGGDYSASMLDNAQRNLHKTNITNLQLVNYDISSPIDIGDFDLVYTTRCLINLPDWERQKAALQKISMLLAQRGICILVENFLDGQKNLNNLRKEFNLPEIAIRAHNCFFDQELLLSFAENDFTIERVVNISSAYYMVTRVIYSKICQETGVEPNYFDDHHKLAAKLPFCGNYGPIKMVILERK
jgi:SAM-dependent methyltransferase